MRFDSGQWHPHNSAEPKPVKSKSYLLMCETRDASKPLPVIRWYRNGRAVRNNRHFYIIVSFHFCPSLHGNTDKNYFQIRPITVSQTRRCDATQRILQIPCLQPFERVTSTQAGVRVGKSHTSITWKYLPGFHSSNPYYAARNNTWAILCFA